MSPAERLVFLDPCESQDPRCGAAALSRLSRFADEHREVGTPVIWLRRPAEFDVPRSDLILPLDHESTSLDRAIALVEAIAKHDVPPAQCFAYGDLCIDDVALSLVGNPRVVPCSPEQARMARSRGFVLTTGPRP